IATSSPVGRLKRHFLQCDYWWFGSIDACRAHHRPASFHTVEVAFLSADGYWVFQVRNIPLVIARQRRLQERHRAGGLMFDEVCSYANPMTTVQSISQLQTFEVLPKTCAEVLAA